MSEDEYVIRSYIRRAFILDGEINDLMTDGDDIDQAFREAIHGAIIDTLATYVMDLMVTRTYQAKGNERS